MDEQKAKFAFAKIKDDIHSLRVQIGHLENQFKIVKENISLNEDVKKQIEDIKKFNLEKFVNKMELELGNVNKLLKDFNKKFNDSSSLMNNFSQQIETYNNEFSDFKKKVFSAKNETANTNLDLDRLNKKFEEYQELINEKINLEISQVRLETSTEIARLYSNLTKDSSSQPKKKVSTKTKK